MWRWEQRNPDDPMTERTIKKEHFILAEKLDLFKTNIL